MVVLVGFVLFVDLLFVLDTSDFVLNVGGILSGLVCC